MRAFELGRNITCMCYKLKFQMNMLNTLPAAEECVFGLQLALWGWFVVLDGCVENKHLTLKCHVAMVQFQAQAHCHILQI